MELSKPYKGKGKRKIKKMPFTVKGYIFGYLTGGVDANALNVIYNLADFVNKIAFGLVIWAAAMQNTRLSSR